MDDTAGARIASMNWIMQPAVPIMQHARRLVEMMETLELTAGNGVLAALGGCAYGISGWQIWSRTGCSGDLSSPKRPSRGATMNKAATEYQARAFLYVGLGFIVRHFHRLMNAGFGKRATCQCRGAEEIVLSFARAGIFRCQSSWLPDKNSNSPARQKKHSDCSSSLNIPVRPADRRTTDAGIRMRAQSHHAGPAQKDRPFSDVNPAPARGELRWRWSCESRRQGE